MQQVYIVIKRVKSPGCIYSDLFWTYYGILVENLKSLHTERTLYTLNEWSYWKKWWKNWYDIDVLGLSFKGYVVFPRKEKSMQIKQMGYKTIN